MEFKIDAELKSLCRKLTKEEYSLLEQNIIQTGCKERLDIWNGFIVDGHNRYEICKKNRIEFLHRVLNFNNKDEVKVYIIENQLGRRNLSDLDRVALLEVKRPILERQARERQKEHGGTAPGKSLMVNLPEVSQPPIREQLAQEAGVSGKTYDSLRKINQKGSEELKDAVREKKISVSSASKMADLPKSEQVIPEIKVKRKLPENPTFVSRAFDFVAAAISQLERIRPDDENKQAAFDKLTNWIKENR